MKTKNCPFCSQEISDEAIICKFCHRLLIDENGNDILPEDELPEAAEEAAVTEDKTIVYKKEDLQKLLNKKESEEEEDFPEEDDEVFEEDDDDEADAETIIDDTDEEEGAEDGEDVAESEEEDEEDDGFPEDDDFDNGDEEEDDGYEGYEYENTRAPMPQRASRRPSPRDDRYDDADLAAAADYDPKRTFIVTAVVTLGILLVIIVAILAGYKLFGFGSKEDPTAEKKPVANAASTAAADVNTSAAAAPGTTSGTDDSAFVPSVVNDTLSENPEEIVNSAASDPVVDSAATAPEASTPDSSAASTDSGMNIVIRPDPNAGDPNAVTDSTTDSQQPGDGPSSSDASTNSAAEPAGPGAPGFEAAGSYYSWGEAETLMANYASSNGLGSNYSYYGGTDGVEMLYAFYDDFGNATVYRVDLQTGYVTAS